MSLAAALHAGLGLVPVGAFLAGLLALDSFKLVRLRWIVRLIVLGAAAAAAAFLLNRALLGSGLAGPAVLRRLAAPLLEEALKALPVLALLRRGRAGFLVDAAIYGFAAGTGFALLENGYYLLSLPAAPPSLWIVRGTGTAVMHGGTTAILAMTTQALFERRQSRGWVLALPGYAAAAIIHMGFNAFLLPPSWSAVAVLLTLPPLMILSFAQNEAYLRAWLGRGFDFHASLLEALQAGGFPDTPPGRYLLALQERFSGEVMADLLCYLHLCTELSLKAKVFLILQEKGVPVPKDPTLAEKLAELRFLRRSIGATGELAVHPILQLKAHDLWQLENLAGT